MECFTLILIPADWKDFYHAYTHSNTDARVHTLSSICIHAHHTTTFIEKMQNYVFFKQSNPTHIKRCLHTF